MNELKQKLIQKEKEFQLLKLVERKVREIQERKSRRKDEINLENLKNDLNAL